MKLKLVSKFPEDAAWLVWGKKRLLALKKMFPYGKKKLTPTADVQVHLDAAQDSITVFGSGWQTEHLQMFVTGHCALFWAGVRRDPFTLIVEDLAHRRAQLEFSLSYTDWVDQVIDVEDDGYTYLTLERQFLPPEQITFKIKYKTAGGEDCDASTTGAIMSAEELRRDLLDGGLPLSYFSPDVQCAVSNVFMSGRAYVCLGRAVVGGPPYYSEENTTLGVFYRLSPGAWSTVLSAPAFYDSTTVGVVAANELAAPTFWVEYWAKPEGSPATTQVQEFVAWELADGLHTYQTQWATTSSWDFYGWAQQAAVSFDGARFACLTGYVESEVTSPVSEYSLFDNGIFLGVEHAWDDSALTRISLNVVGVLWWSGGGAEYDRVVEWVPGLPLIADKTWGDPPESRISYAYPSTARWVVIVRAPSRLSETYPGTYIHLFEIKNKLSGAWASVFSGEALYGVTGAVSFGVDFYVQSSNVCSLHYSDDHGVQTTVFTFNAGGALSVLRVLTSALEYIGPTLVVHPSIEYYADDNMLFRSQTSATSFTEELLVHTSAGWGTFSLTTKGGLATNTAPVQPVAGHFFWPPVEYSSSVPGVPTYHSVTVYSISNDAWTNSGSFPLNEASPTHAYNLVYPRIVIDGGSASIGLPCFVASTSEYVYKTFRYTRDEFGIWNTDSIKTEFRLESLGAIPGRQLYVYAPPATDESGAPTDTPSATRVTAALSSASWARTGERCQSVAGWTDYRSAFGASLVPGFGYRGLQGKVWNGF